MSLTKEQNIDKIEIANSGIVQVRQVTRIIEDGVVLSSTYHRWTLEPGQDISEFDDRVKSICDLLWTPQVITSYQEQKAASLASITSTAE